MQHVLSSYHYPGIVIALIAACCDPFPTKSVVVDSSHSTHQTGCFNAPSCNDPLSVDVARPEKGVVVELRSLDQFGVCYDTNERRFVVLPFVADTMSK